MKADVKICDAKAEYYFEEGCFINELSNSENDAEVSIARARVACGGQTRWHLLRGITERYILLEGTGWVEVEGLPGQSVSVGDVVIIPPGARQRIRNTGEGDLIFLAVCSPRFLPEAYVDTEEDSAS